MRRMLQWLLRSACAFVILRAFQVISCGAFVVNESVESGLRCSYRVGGAWRCRWQVVNAVLWIGCFCLVVLVVGKMNVLGSVINSKVRISHSKTFSTLMLTLEWNDWNRQVVVGRAFCDSLRDLSASSAVRGMELPWEDSPCCRNFFRWMILRYGSSLMGWGFGSRRGSLVHPWRCCCCRYSLGFRRHRPATTPRPNLWFGALRRS